MPSERLRILELALESLEYKKRQLDEEIAALTHELKRGKKANLVLSTLVPARLAQNVPKARKRSHFSKQERARRAARMKAYWDKWRKEKAKKG
jgi:hypothetical protein